MPDNDPITPGTFVKALFAIDARTPDDVFEGWHDPEDHWNGFGVPSFDRDNALKVIAWVADYEDSEASPRTTFRWDDGNLIMTETYDDEEQYEQHIGPDAHGRYWIGASSWTWNEIQVPDGEALGVWLQRSNENAHVYAAANNIANAWAIEAGIGWPARRIPTEKVASNAVAYLARLRPADPNQALGDETLAQLNLTQNGLPTRTGLTWTALTSEERAVVLNLAVARATQPAELRRAFEPKSVI